MAAGKLFWSMRKNDRARVWMKRAVTKNPDIGDFWAILYVFELQNGSEDQQKEVIQDCIKANPHHGDVWPVIRKQRENRRKTTTEILKLVADRLKDSILEFCSLNVCFIVSGYSEFVFIDPSLSTNTSDHTNYSEWPFSTSLSCFSKTVMISCIMSGFISSSTSVPS